MLSAYGIVGDSLIYYKWDVSSDICFYDRCFFGFEHGSLAQNPRVVANEGINESTRSRSLILTHRRRNEDRRIQFTFRHGRL